MIDKLVSLAAYLAAIFFLLVLMACLFLATAALAHDIYTNVYEGNAPKTDSQRRLCCGGDKDRGDCEGMTYDQMQEVPGGVRLVSKRYGAVVFVPNNRITWDVPRDGFSGEAADKHNTHPIHWCGKPRPSGWAPDERNPDPSWVTFCAFIAPGGV